jgi:hypothetical protein
MSTLVDNKLCNQVPGTNGEPIITTDEDLYEELDYVDFYEYDELTALMVHSSFPKEFTFIVMAGIYNEEDSSTALMESSAAPFILIETEFYFISLVSQDDLIEFESGLDYEWRSFYLHVKDDGTTTTYTFAIIKANEENNIIKTGTINSRVSTDATDINLIRSYYSTFVHASLFKGNVPISEVTLINGARDIMWCSTPLFYYIEGSEDHLLGICSSILFISVQRREPYYGLRTMHHVSL